MFYKLHEKSRGLRVKIIKSLFTLKSCPNCSYFGKSIWFVHEFCANKWYIECPKCHWCGKDKKLMLGALYEWNKD